MKFKKEYVLNGPVDMIWEAREKRYENLDKFPELKNRQELDRKEKDGMLHVKSKLKLASKVPGALRRVMKDDSFDIIDNSEYNLETGEHKFTYNSERAKFFKCKGYSKYTEFEENGDKKTKRLLEFEVKVNVPVVGGLAEQFITDAIKKNLEKDNTSIERMIQMMKEGDA